MFYYSAIQKLAAEKAIQIFNYGNMRRDFTYIDDYEEGKSHRLWETLLPSRDAERHCTRPLNVIL